MAQERVTLSGAEQRRLLVLNHLELAAVTVVEAAQLVGGLGEADPEVPGHVPARTRICNRVSRTGPSTGMR